jgi:hypothetical protein
VFQLAGNVVPAIRLLILSGTATTAVPMSLTTALGTSFFAVLYAGAALFAVFRAVWVISGRTQLESPGAGTFISALRDFAVFLMFLGVCGKVAMFGAILALPILGVFALPFQGALLFGLLLFESARVLAFESDTSRR